MVKLGIKEAYQRSNPMCCCLSLSVSAQVHQCTFAPKLFLAPVFLRCFGKAVRGMRALRRPHHLCHLSPSPHIVGLSCVELLFGQASLRRWSLVPRIAGWCGQDGRTARGSSWRPQEGEESQDLFRHSSTHL
jgi:hypothetical protein